MRRPVQINRSDLADRSFLRRVHPASIRTLIEPGWLGACWGPLGGCCNLRSGLEALCSRRSHPDAVFGAHLRVGTLAKHFQEMGVVGGWFFLGGLLLGLPERVVDLTRGPKGMEQDRELTGDGDHRSLLALLAPFSQATRGRD